MILTQSFDILFVLKCYTLFWILLNKSLLVPFIGPFNFAWTLHNFACYGWETNSLNKLVQKRWVLSTIKLHFVHAFTNLNMCHYAYFSFFPSQQRYYANCLTISQQTHVRKKFHSDLNSLLDFVCMTNLKILLKTQVDYHMHLKSKERITYEFTILISWNCMSRRNEFIKLKKI